MATNRKQVVAYLEHKQHADLKKLSEKTRVPMQVYLREAVDMVLKKYKGRKS